MIIHQRPVHSATGKNQAFISFIDFTRACWTDLGITSVRHIFAKVLLSSVLFHWVVYTSEHSLTRFRGRPDFLDFLKSQENATSSRIQEEGAQNCFVRSKESVKSTKQIACGKHQVYECIYITIEISEKRAGTLAAKFPADA